MVRFSKGRALGMAVAIVRCPYEESNLSNTSNLFLSQQLLVTLTTTSNLIDIKVYNVESLMLGLICYIRSRRT